MTENDIIKYFGVDPESEIPLRTQLERKLQLYVDSSAPGTAIPPERLMARCLGVSRVTVRNAIPPFLETGSIVRHNRNGTVVASKKYSKPLEINELATGLPWRLEPVATLKFLCYETLPHQRVFWENAVEEFNSINTGCQCEIVWLDKLLKGHVLLDFIAENEIDVMLYSNMYELPFSTLAAELPPDLQRVVDSPDFIFKDMAIEKRNIFRYMLPLQMVYFKTFYNKQLAEKCGLKNVGAWIYGSEKIQLMREALPRLDKNQFASSHIWCHIAYRMIIPEKENRSLLYNALNEMHSVSNYSNAFMLSQRHSLDDAEKFIKGEMLFFDGTFSQLQHIGEPAFEIGQQITCPFEKTDISAVPLGITISRHPALSRRPFPIRHGRSSSGLRPSSLGAVFRTAPRRTP